MKFISFIILLSITLLNPGYAKNDNGILSGEKCAMDDPPPPVRQNVRIAFYNTENLYDPYDDTTTLDNEFTREGLKHWTYGKFRAKLNHLAKVIIAMMEHDTLAFIGLCEVENKFVLNKLVYDSPLKSWHYRIIHHDSPDARGVDVVALYHPKKLSIIRYRYITVTFPFDTLAKTREILYIKGLLTQGDTIHLMVNHWPSRRGGEAGSEPRRVFVAGMLKHLSDSILHDNPLAAVVMMGDLNDEPVNRSVREVLGAGTDTAGTSDTSLVNMMALLRLPWNEGTLKYRGRWNIFDQFIVSGNMLNGNGALHLSPASAGIFRASFLMEEDRSYFGDRLNRTYIGPGYHGGFSDHLPVYLDCTHSP
jgi:hypothetical protein